MVTQLSLVLQGEANKADGMARAWDAANSDWKTAARSVVQQLAASNSEFTTDDVWAQLDALGFTTREHRAMGAVMRAAAVDGLIVKTDRVVPTTRPCANRRPVAVWHSLQSQPIPTTTHDNLAAAARPNEGQHHVDLQPLQWPPVPSERDHLDLSGHQDPAADRGHHGQQTHLGTTGEPPAPDVGSLRPSALEPKPARGFSTAPW